MDVSFFGSFFYFIRWRDLLQCSLTLLRGDLEREQVIIHAMVHQDDDTSNIGITISASLENNQVYNRRQAKLPKGFQPSINHLIRMQKVITCTFLLLSLPCNSVAASVIPPLDS